MPKFKTTIIFFSAVAVLVIILGIITKLNQAKNESGDAATENQEDRSFIEVSGVRIFIEIADTPEKQQEGLSGREVLGENEGMLFIFSSKDTRPSFWMKGMLIPLDFIWIDDNRVIQVHKNVQPPKPDTPERELQVLAPEYPIDYVLEVNAGFVEKNNVQVGDNIKLNF